MAGSSYTCPHCDAVSVHPEDARQKYCGRCHRWAEEGPRFSWSQPCCAACWFTLNPDRQPTRLREPEIENCALCENPTYDGIYIRIDPAAAPYPSRLKD